MSTAIGTTEPFDWRDRESPFWRELLKYVQDVARWYLPDRDQAEEIASIVLAKVVEKLRNGDLTKPPWALSRRIVKHEVINELRRIKKRPTSQCADQIPGHSANTVSVTTQLEESLIAIHRCAKHLPPRYQLILKQYEVFVLQFQRLPTTNDPDFIAITGNTSAYYLASQAFSALRKLPCFGRIAD